MGNTPKDQVVVTIALSAEDLPRLQQAFADGELADLGVVDLLLPGDRSTGKWTRSVKGQSDQEPPEAPTRR